MHVDVHPYEHAGSTNIFQNLTYSIRLFIFSSHFIKAFFNSFLFIYLLYFLFHMKAFGCFEKVYTHVCIIVFGKGSVRLTYLKELVIGQRTKNKIICFRLYRIGCAIEYVIVFVLSEYFFGILYSYSMTWILWYVEYWMPTPSQFCYQLLLHCSSYFELLSIITTD